MVSEPRGSRRAGGRRCSATPPRRRVRGGRDLLRQRRLPRHVRARHDRPRRRRSRTSAASAPGMHRIETPVGVVTRRAARRTAASRVATCRATGWPRRDASTCPGHGTRARATSPGAATGSSSCATTASPLELANLGALTRLHPRASAQALARGRRHRRRRSGDRPRRAVRAVPDAGADSRNFVLCPGRAYDRSPCGTGTSAKLACLPADGALQPGEVWRQESVIGSVFEGLRPRSRRPRPRSSRASPARPTSPPRPRCCWTSAIRSAGASASRVGRRRPDRRRRRRRALHGATTRRERGPARHGARRAPRPRTRAARSATRA